MADYHDSCCAVHNEPAYPNGPCNCSLPTRKRLLASLPIEIWTDSEDGQTLFELWRRGLCTYKRLNSTLGRFGPIAADKCDCSPWPDKCPYCGEEITALISQDQHSTDGGR